MNSMLVVNIAALSPPKGIPDDDGLSTCNPTMTPTQPDPLRGFFGTLCKFIIAFFIVFTLSGADSFWFNNVMHVFWIIPVIWGIMGIFWFEKMLTVARDWIEWVFGIGDR